MKTLLTAFVLIAAMALSCQAESPNVLLICVDDLRPELASFGVDYVESPNIDRSGGVGPCVSSSLRQRADLWGVTIYLADRTIRDAQQQRAF